ncbi:MAG: acyltransferase [Terracidiphilus sp.]|jgi:peptidoglycan/LPS O-acetylase OafA/YrhL
MTTPQVPRIHTLDGWRGVAILLVIAGHAAHYSQYRNQLWANLWCLGVDIFFVLSGYIITLKFIQERDKSATIDLHSFYLRRAFRILPLVCAYLATLCVLSLFVNLVDFHPSEIAGSLFFFRNYQLAAVQQGFYTTHFWSLSIEEHFYLLWPALFLWLGNRRSLWFAGVGACTCAMWRLYDCTHPDSWIGRYLPGPDNFFRQIRTDARFDGLLLGCGLAMILCRQPVRNFIFRNFPKEVPLFAAMLLGLNIERTHGWPTLSSYLIVVAMVGCTLVVEEGLAHKGLNSRVMVWIGTVSYSAYVWQELFMTRPGPSLSPLGILGYFPFNLICVFAVSALSYYFIERPCIEQGRRFLTRRRERIAAASSA